MESTVDWIEGSKNLATCLLWAREFGSQFANKRAQTYPVNVNLPALISHMWSLSLGEPNLTYWTPSSFEKTLFTPSSNLWTNAARSSDVSNLEPLNFSGCGLGDGSVSETSERTLDHCSRPRCNELPALEQT